MANFAQDSFAGTAASDLSAHVDALSSAWSYSTGSGLVLTGTGLVRPAATAGAPAVAVDHGAPASADYSVYGDLTWQTSQSGADFAGIVGRASSSADTCYVLTAYSGSWTIIKRVAGAGSIPAQSGTAVAITPGTVYHAELRFAGSSILGFVNGAQVVTLTDTAITAAGFAGIFLQAATNPTNSAGPQVGAFSAAPTSSASFALTDGSGTATVSLGSSTTVLVTETGSGGFTDPVALTVSGLPSGVTGSFSPATITGGSGTSTLTLTASSGATVGTSTATITGTDAGVTHTVALALTVTSAPALLTVSKPAGPRVFQRNRTTKAGTILIKGTNNDTAAHSIEAGFKGGAFATIATGVAAGANFSGSLAGQPQGRGALVVRFVDAPSNTLTVANVGVGLRAFLVGQSNGQGQYTNLLIDEYPNFTASLIALDGMCKRLQDPCGSPANALYPGLWPANLTAAGSIAPPLASLLMADQDCPVEIIMGCRDGAGWTSANGNGQWGPVPLNHADTTTLYGASLALARQGDNETVEVIIPIGGETDSANAVGTSAEAAGLAALYSAWLADLPGAAICQPLLPNLGTFSSPGNTALINAAITQAIAATSGAHAGGDLTVFTVDVPPHFNAIAYQRAVSATIFSAIHDGLYAPTGSGSGSGSITDASVQADVMAALAAMGFTAATVTAININLDARVSTRSTLVGPAYFATMAINPADGSVRLDGSRPILIRPQAGITAPTVNDALAAAHSLAAGLETKAGTVLTLKSADGNPFVVSDLDTATNPTTRTPRSS
jgi:hypothetical protein